MPEPDAPSGGVLPAIDGLVADVLPDKDKMYFNDYSTLVQQQGMLQDQVRTSIYQFAILENAADFRGKRVLDVGAGTGILSFFAARAGAARVFAVEASGMARHAEQLAAANGLAGEVSVLNQRVEDVELDERVDILISEPLGIALVNERRLPPSLLPSLPPCAGPSPPLAREPRAADSAPPHGVQPPLFPAAHRPSYASAAQVDREYGVTLSEAPSEAAYDAVIVAVNHKEYVDFDAASFHRLYKRTDLGFLVDIKGIYRHLSAELNYWSF